jgi:hypothetical protein
LKSEFYWNNEEIHGVLDKKDDTRKILFDSYVVQTIVSKYQPIERLKYTNEAHFK